MLRKAFGGAAGVAAAGAVASAVAALQGSPSDAATTALWTMTAVAMLVAFGCGLGWLTTRDGVPTTANKARAQADHHSVALAAGRDLNIYGSQTASDGAEQADKLRGEHESRRRKIEELTGFAAERNQLEQHPGAGSSIFFLRGEPSALEIERDLRRREYELLLAEWQSRVRRWFENKGPEFLAEWDAAGTDDKHAVLLAIIREIRHG